MRSPSFTREPLAISLVRVMRLNWPEIWGTRIFVEWTASTVPVTRTSRARRGGSAGAAWVTAGVGREQELTIRIRAAMAHTGSFISRSRKLDGGGGGMV